MIAHRSRGKGPGQPRASYDVLIVGGGPAGLSAALMLGRCRRRVLILDSGHPRNAAAQAMHGYLTRDGIAPCELLKLGRAEVAAYQVEVLDTEVVSAQLLPPCVQPGCLPEFEVTTVEGRSFFSRKLLLATGTRDVLPEIEGIDQYYGRAVHHCPYCDGWEHRDEHLVAYGEGPAAAGLALSLKRWSDRITACTDGRKIKAEDKKRLDDNSIALRIERIARLAGSDGVLHRVEFEDGPPLECDALFFNTGQTQHSKLPTMLGCQPRERGMIPTHGKQQTNVPGLFLAGDADDDVQFVIVAAAEGTRAAVAINRELQDEDREMAQRASHVPELRLYDDGARVPRTNIRRPSRRKRPG